MVRAFFQIVLDIVRGVSLLFWRLVGLVLVISGFVFLMRETNLIGAGEYDATLSFVAERLGMNPLMGYGLIVSIIGIGIVCLVHRPRRRVHL
jgi:hypothetical protein